MEVIGYEENSCGRAGMFGGIFHVFLRYLRMGSIIATARIVLKITVLLTRTEMASATTAGVWMQMETAYAAMWMVFAVILLMRTKTGSATTA